jgi:hypothetical protein
LLKGKGLRLIAVDTGDKADLIRRFVKEKGYTFPIVMDKEKGGAFDSYKVEACPTNYLVNAKGKIVYAATGFDEKGLRTALGSLGIR